MKSSLSVPPKLEASRTSSKFFLSTDGDEEAREREWQARHQIKEKRHHGEDFSSEESDELALAIEPPPQQPPADSKYPQAQVSENRPAPAFEGRPAPSFEGRSAPDPTALAGYATEA